MIRKLFILISITLFASPLSLFAHDGHGFFSGGEITHYLTSPFHVLPVLCIVCIGAWYVLKNRKVNQPDS